MRSQNWNRIPSLFRSYRDELYDRSLYDKYKPDPFGRDDFRYERDMPPRDLPYRRPPYEMPPPPRRPSIDCEVVSLSKENRFVCPFWSLFFEHFHSVFLEFWNFQRRGGMKDFQRQGRDFLGGASDFCGPGRGNSKLRHKNDFENDIDSKVKPEISFLNISLYSKQF